jgi:hypothetical protein
MTKGMEEAAGFLFSPLAALSIAYDCRFVTADRGFQSYPGLQVGLSGASGKCRTGCSAKLLALRPHPGCGGPFRGSLPIAPGPPRRAAGYRCAPWRSAASSPGTLGQDHISYFPADIFGFFGLLHTGFRFLYVFYHYSLKK